MIYILWVIISIAKMKIINQKRFEYNLEYLEELKHAKGSINESIICLVDYMRNITAVTEFLTREFKNFGLEVTVLDKAYTAEYFKDNEINYYYFVKEYMIEKLEKLKERNETKMKKQETDFFKDFTC